MGRNGILALLTILALAATATAGGKASKPTANVKPAPSEVRGKAAYAPNRQDLDWLVVTLPKPTVRLSTMQRASQQDRIAELRRRAAEAYLKVLDHPAIKTGDRAAEAIARAAEIYYSQLKDVKRAMEVYAVLTEHYRGSPSAEAAAAKIGKYLQGQGKFKQAVEAYDRLIERHPQNAAVEHARFARGECYEKLREWAKAIDAYEQYLRVFPKGKWAAEATRQVQWIRTYHQTGSGK
jgi:tetratricopeptide (TPR) repeat protein